MSRAELLQILLTPADHEARGETTYFLSTQAPTPLTASQTLVRPSFISLVAGQPSAKSREPKPVSEPRAQTRAQSARASSPWSYYSSERLDWGFRHSVIVRAGHVTRLEQAEQGPRISATPQSGPSPRCDFREEARHPSTRVDRIDTLVHSINPALSSRIISGEHAFLLCTRENQDEGGAALPSVMLTIVEGWTIS